MESKVDDPACKSARQIIETGVLMGVDFVPVRMNVSDSHEPVDVGGGERRAEKQAQMDALRDEYEREMPPDPGAPHTKVVFGDGDPDADLMFIGEAPGAEEDRLGVPFVGRSGKKLTEMIEAMGLSRAEVYIANVLKRRPPGNATPTPEEAQAHGPWLLRQVEIVEPRVIVTLGKPAANYLLGTREAMTRLRGHWFDYHGIPVMPTFHPAFLLRQYTRENREKVWSDLQQALARLEVSD